MLVLTELVWLSRFSKFHFRIDAMFVFEIIIFEKGIIINHKYHYLKYLINHLKYINIQNIFTTH